MKSANNTQIIDLSDEPVIFLRKKQVGTLPISTIPFYKKGGVPSFRQTDSKVVRAV